MADIQLKGSAGSDAADGLTWTNAKATMVAAVAAGNPVWCDKATGESVTGSNLTITAGTQAAPVMVTSGFEAATTGLSSPAAGYGVTVSGGTFAIAINGWGHYDGIVWTCGTGTNNGSISLCQSGDNVQHYLLNSFILGGSGASARINCGIGSTSNATRVVWDACNVQFAGTGQSISVQNSWLRWNGGAVISGTTPTKLFSTLSGRFAKIEVFGVDLSALANTFYFLDPVSGGGPVELTVIGCKLPSGWASSQLINSPGQINARAELYDCDDGNNGYVRFAVQDPYGSAVQETTTTITGVGDDLSDYSIKIVSSSVSEWPCLPFRLHPQYKRNTATGSSKTLTVEITSDDATLTNKDVVLRARFYGSTTSPLIGEQSSAPRVTLTATALTTSAQAWNSAKAHTYKISVSFTPNRKGYVTWDVLLFKPSTTVYVSPKAVIS